MSEQIPVMIVDESLTHRESLRMLVASTGGVRLVGEARLGDDALHKIGVSKPAIVLLNIENSGDSVSQAIETICHHYPRLAVIVLSQHKDWYFVRQYMRAGAKDYLYMPVPPEILEATIREVYQMSGHHTPDTSANIPAEIEPLSESPQQCPVFSFVSTKGGVGKTTVAVNVACALQKRGKRVAFLDLDLQSGVSHMLLGTEPQRTMADLAREADELDTETVSRYTLQSPTGVTVLCAPKRPEEQELIQPSHVAGVIEVLERNFDYLIVDTAPLVNEVLLAALDKSHYCFAISTLNLTVLKNNRAMIDLLRNLGPYGEKIKHILNRATVKGTLKETDAVKALGANIYSSLNNDDTFVGKSINEGVPFVVSSPQHRLSKQVFSMVDKLISETGQTRDSKRPRKKLRIVRA